MDEDSQCLQCGNQELEDVSHDEYSGDWMCQSCGEIFKEPVEVEYAG